MRAFKPGPGTAAGRARRRPPCGSSVFIAVPKELRSGRRTIAGIRPRRRPKVVREASPSRLRPGRGLTPVYWRIGVRRRPANQGTGWRRRRGVGADSWPAGGLRGGAIHRRIEHVVSRARWKLSVGAAGPKARRAAAGHWGCLPARGAGDQSPVRLRRHLQQPAAHPGLQRRLVLPARTSQIGSTRPSPSAFERRRRSHVALTVCGPPCRSSSSRLVFRQPGRRRAQSVAMPESSLHEHREPCGPAATMSRLAGQILAVQPVGGRPSDQISRAHFAVSGRGVLALDPAHHRRALSPAE